ncbi:unnamed protein product [Oppiella nova]|uniref:Uncharacterized protein n=1 Tax=Oppiella nova TaxID=334625 RepID=A0A7R9LJ60_9ACAR|nr:unnamed protein product [Oppiella nova]CAG2164133.1 unnamed protein product [Oppiella nova]
MAFKNQKALTGVKIGLEVLYILSIIGCVFIIVVLSLGLTQKEQKVDNHTLTVGLIAGVFGLLISVVGLVGIIKEIKWIVTTLLVLQIIGFTMNLTTGEVRSGLYGIVTSILTGVFLCLIIEKQNEGLEVPNTNKV